MHLKPIPAKTDPLVAEQARIRTLLAVAGLTMAAIDREFGLPEGAAKVTLRQPNLNGERAIAAALNTHAHLLWPSRYRPNGTRRQPQNYAPLPTLAERRKFTGAQT